MNENNKNNKLYSIEHLEEILNRIPYEIWIEDINGRYIYGNKLFCEKLGITKEELIWKKDFDFRVRESEKNCEFTDKVNKDICIEENIILEENKSYYKLNKFIVNNKDDNIYLGVIAEEVTLKSSIQLDLEDSITNCLEKYNFDEYDNEEFLLNTINSIKKITHCKEIDIFLYDQYKTKLQLYLSTYGTNENIEIFLDDNINSKILNFKVSEEVQSLLKEKIVSLRDSYSSFIINIKPLKLLDKTIGVIIFYYEDSNDCLFQDESSLNEILSKIAMIIKQEENHKTLIQIKNEKEDLKSLVELECIKNEFFANVSHEFRTPVNMIISVVQLLESVLYKKNNNIDRESYVKYLNILRQNSYRLLRLVNNTVDTAKIKNDMYDLKLVNNNIIGIIEDIVMSTVDYASEKNRNIIFDTDVEELVIACDEDKIERVILNLISNSIKFSHDNTDIEINIKTDFD